MASILYGFLLFCGVCTLGLVCLTKGQDPTAESVGEPYKPMTLDYAIRGSHNISTCLEHLFNCWEAARPGIICVRYKFIETICSKMRNMCHEVYGPIYYYRDIMGAVVMYDRYCHNEQTSKRRQFSNTTVL
ncbi:hypothetical protein K1T71_013730 [Dendrolimus kikuchii]|uniref:Uncharacterized protein n=1 Tax=Dendrolimus kikuchii TaxID=765133 RepID=A0ACC1CH88_9NEOP|nr:hypothetical protein K1T71_013730 [Dendrolimus kikuchii]